MTLHRLAASVKRQDTNYLCQGSALGAIYNQIAVIESIVCICSQTWTM